MKILQTFKNKMAFSQLKRKLKVDNPKVNYSVKMAEDGGITITMLVPMNKGVFTSSLLKLLDKTAVVRYDGKTKVYDIKYEHLPKIKGRLKDKEVLENILNDIKNKLNKDFKFTGIQLVKMSVMEGNEIIAEMVYYGGWSE